MEVSEAGVWAASLEVAMMVAIRPGRVRASVISSAEQTGILTLMEM